MTLFCDFYMTSVKSKVFFCRVTLMTPHLKKDNRHVIRGKCQAKRNTYQCLLSGNDSTQYMAYKEHSTRQAENVVRMTTKGKG